MSDKTLVERLREGNTANGTCAGAVICSLLNEEHKNQCVCTTCRNCINDMMSKLADAIEREYLPSPRFEDGEPVQFGDKFESAGIVGTVDYILKGNVEGCVIGRKEDSGCVTYPNGKRVKRPEPEVLDADGVPIHLGDTVYLTEGVDAGKPLMVDIIHDNGVVNVAVEPERWANHAPETLTHKKPVLDADGVPIRVGDTVWEVGGSIELTVRELNPNDEWPVFTSYAHYYKSSQLTHKQPDSLERIEADAKLDVCDYYAGRDEHKCDGCRGAYCFECKHEMTLDLLRRQREVLERVR